MFISYLIILLCLFKNMNSEQSYDLFENCFANLTLTRRNEYLEMKNTNVQLCVADCLDLNNLANKNCWYDENDGSIIETKEDTIKRFVPDRSSDFKIYCHYYVISNGYLLANLTSVVQTGLCTDIIVEGFAEIVKIEDNKFSVKERDVANSFVKELQSTTAKYKGFRFHLSLEDPSNLTSIKFSEMVKNEETRKYFITAATKFLDHHNFIGLHLNWQYPVCWMTDCDRGPKSDKKNYALLIKEISIQFKPLAFIISCIVPKDFDYILQGYDMTSISNNIDVAIVATFLDHGTWEKTLEHSTTVKDIKSSVTFGFSNKNKLVPSLRIWWGIYTMADKNKTKPGFRSLKEQIKYPGDRSFYELCNLINEEQWNVSRSVSDKSVYYAYKDDQWVSYEDVANIRFKAKYLIEAGFKGVSLLTVNADDFSGRCGCGKFPLLRALNEELRGQKKELPDCT